MLGAAASLVVLVGLVCGGTTAGAAPPPSNCRGVAAIVTCTFSYNGSDGSNGSVQTFVVPAGVTQVTVEAWGAQGGDISGAVGGPGGYSEGTVSVAPGQILTVRVGGKPTGTAGGYNGGGPAGPAQAGEAGAAGGGATDIRQGGDDLTHRIVVAGGGGGSAYDSGLNAIGGEYNNWSIALGGDGGGTSGAQSVACTDSPWQACGQGATAGAGGSPGTTMTTPCAVGGTAGVGGAGCGSGGGGGYFGGGGGGYGDQDCCGSDIAVQGPGGGGSGYVLPSATAPRTEAGLQFGNGLVRLSYVTAHRYPGLVWSAPVPIDTTGATVTGISCPTSTFCVAVDSAGNAGTFAGDRWSAFTPVSGPGNSFTAVSCASTSFCAAVGVAPPNSHYGQDLAVTDKYGVWSSNSSQTVAPGDILTSVSCAKNTELCTAVGWADSSPGNTAISETYDGDTWTGHNDGMGYGSDGDTLTAVSCASATFCVAGGLIQDRNDIGDYLGIAYHHKGGGGQITDQPTDGLLGSIDAIGCGGDSCFAAGNGTFVFPVTRASWSGPTDPDGASTISAISCTDSSTCVAVDTDGNEITAASGVWSAPVSIDPAHDLTGVSCPTATFCAAVDAEGSLIVGSR